MAVVEAVQVQSEEGYRVHFRSPSIRRVGVIILVPIRQRQKQVSGMNESQNRQTASTTSHHIAKLQMNVSTNSQHCQHPFHSIQSKQQFNLNQPQPHESINN